MLFCAYYADEGNPQVSHVDLNIIRENRVSFLARKTSFVGIIKCLILLYGVDLYFTTGGSDYAVVLRNTENDFWYSKTL